MLWNLAQFFLMQGIDSGWYSLIMGIIILVVILGCIGACVLASYYMGKRQQRKPKTEQSTLVKSLHLWAMLIQVYILIIAIIFGALHFFMPQLFVPSLALPVVGGVLLGVVAIFVLSYIIVRKAPHTITQTVSTKDVKTSRPTVCPVCKRRITADDQFCAECGAAIE